MSRRAVFTRGFLVGLLLFAMVVHLKDGQGWQAVIDVLFIVLFSWQVFWGKHE